MRTFHFSYYLDGPGSARVSECTIDLAGSLNREGLQVIRDEIRNQHGDGCLVVLIAWQELEA